MFGLQLFQGDFSPPVAMTLTDLAGNPINLSGLVSLTFQMRDVNTGDLKVDSPAAKIQSDNVSTSWGQVTYYWQTRDTSLPGLYQAYFVVDFGGGPTRYPLGDNLYILIKPLVGS